MPKSARMCALRLITLPQPLFALLLMCAVSAFALPATADWSGGLEGGAVQQDDGTATRLRLKLFNHDRPLTHDIHADWTRSTSDNGGGNDSYDVGYIPRYWFSNALYTFGEVLFSVDKPLGIEQQLQYLAGLGYRLLSTETTLLWAEAGAGYRSIEFRNELLDNHDESLLLGRGGFRQTFAELFRLDLDIKATQGDTVTESTAEASVSVFIGSGYIKYGYRTRRFSQDDLPSVTDSDSFFGFSYAF